MKPIVPYFLLTSSFVSFLYLLSCAPQLGTDRDSDLRALWIDTVQFRQPAGPRQIEELTFTPDREPLFFAPPPSLAVTPFKIELVFSQGYEPSRTGGPEGLVPEMEEGYRVQVFSSQSLTQAQEAEKRVKAITQRKVYLHYDPPQYKVRVGDFLTRSLAIAFCDSIKRLGFQDAWVVRSLIYRPKRPSDRNPELETEGK